MGSIQTGYYKFDSATILTLSGDAITVAQAAHIVAAESGTADDLKTITGISGVAVPYWVVLQADAGDTITVKNGTGNIFLNGGADFELSGNKTLALWFDGTNWADIGAGGGSGSGSGVNFGSASSLTIASGAVTRGASAYYLSIDTESAAASDDLDTINAGGASAGIAVMIKAANTARTVVVKHNTGNIQMNGGIDFSLDNTEKAVLLFWDGTNWIGIGVPISGGGGGTVTSVALTMPAEFSVAGSPVTTSGTLAVSKANQTQNKVFASPDGSTGAPTFRSLVAADVPSLDASKVASGTLVHERGGLEADVSAYDGLIKITGGSTTNIKCNFAAGVAPGVSDDSSAGYGVGSLWYDTTADKAYACLDATVGAAVWVEITAGAGGGEANTASNIGTAGVGLFKSKVGVDLQFKKVNAGSAKITITDDTGNNEVDVDLGTVNFSDLTTKTHDHTNATNGGQLTDAALSAAVGISKGGTGQTTQTAAMDALSPTTTKGDLLVDDGTNVVRLPVGATNGHVLTVDSTQATGLKYAAQSGGGTVIPGTCQGRLTLSSTLPISSADITAATTLYFLPYKGNQIALYDGASAWAYMTIPDAGVSIAFPASTNTNYDVYVYDNSGTLTLELVAWTNDTTRATALASQNGVYVKTGTTSKLYLGTIRTAGVSGQCEDSLTKRFVFNYYNRCIRRMQVNEGNNSWSYTTAAWRALNNSTANRVEVVYGVSEDAIVAHAVANCSGTGGDLGIGLDSTTVNSVSAAGGNDANAHALNAHYANCPAEGYHYLQILEYGNASSATFYGDNGADRIKTGMIATING